ncbi:hypothetical protein EON65_57590 [archaeon]|nr:MAG: hypothetical protein EON65_57590 [archaeon]
MDTTTHTSHTSHTSHTTHTDHDLGHTATLPHAYVPVSIEIRVQNIVDNFGLAFAETFSTSKKVR